MGSKYHERKDYVVSTHQDNRSHVAILVDEWIPNVKQVRKMKYKKIVALLTEPKAIRPKPYKYIKNHMHLFDLVLTYDEDLLTRHPDKCKFTHAIASKFLATPGLHKKNKLVSIIFSGKNLTEGHKLRHAVFHHYKDCFDGYKGPDTPSVHDKGHWQNEYCYSVVIENSRQPHYFTEKITECMLSGTVPIYWGCPTIGQFFDMNGIIVFDKLSDLKKIFDNLSFEDYQRRLPSVRKNYETAHKYDPINQDHFWDNLKQYF